MRAVNDDVRGRVQSDDREYVPFFCECADDDCYQPLWLTPGEYDRLTGSNAFGIAPGHGSRRRPRRIRRALPAGVRATARNLGLT